MQDFKNCINVFSNNKFLMPLTHLTSVNKVLIYIKFFKNIFKIRETRDENLMLREPRTADVIEGIIDVEFNRNHAPSLIKNNSATNFSNYNSNVTSTTNSTTLMANMVKEKMTQNLIAAAYGNLAASISTNNTNNNNTHNLAAPIPCVASTSSLMPSESTSENGQEIATATLVSNMIDVMGCSSSNNTINTSITSNTTSELPSFQFSPASNLSNFKINWF